MENNITQMIPYKKGEKIKFVNFYPDNFYGEFVEMSKLGGFPYNFCFVKIFTKDGNCIAYRECLGLKEIRK